MLNPKTIAAIAVSCVPYKGVPSREIEAEAISTSGSSNKRRRRSWIRLVNRQPIVVGCITHEDVIVGPIKLKTISGIMSDLISCEDVPIRVIEVEAVPIVCN